MMGIRRPFEDATPTTPASYCGGSGSNGGPPITPEQVRPPSLSFGFREAANVAQNPPNSQPAADSLPINLDMKYRLVDKVYLITAAPLGVSQKCHCNRMAYSVSQ